jgi:hypothetical protein
MTLGTKILVVSGTMDLNQLPPEYDFDFIYVEAASPAFCTEARPVDGVFGILWSTSGS